MILPASAVDLLRAVPEWTVDASAGRPLPELLAALADADALDRAQRDEGDARI